MRRPTAARTKRGNGYVGAWGRLGFSFRWQDPPFWRWPRVEIHNHDEAARDAFGVLIGWRQTGLLLAWLDPLPWR